MSSDETDRLEAEAEDGTAGPYRELRRSLEALERAYVRWDLAGIAGHGAASRTHLERARRHPPGNGREVRELADILRLVRRLERLAEAGERLAGSLERVSRLTYEPFRVDEQEERGVRPRRAPVATSGGG